MIKNSINICDQYKICDIDIKFCTIGRRKHKQYTNVE